MSARRCNAKCYNARGPACYCQCNGANHGAGKQQARENARKMGLVWKETAHRTSYRKTRRAVVPEQGRLFTTLQG
jgi:hypothetical protein